MNGTKTKSKKKSAKPRVTPDTCPICGLNRDTYVEHYLHFWNQDNNGANGAGRAWAWHVKGNQKSCDSTKSWLATTEGKTHKDFPKDKYGDCVIPGQSDEDEEEEEQEKEKKPKVEVPLTPEELTTLMETDPGEACRRMISSTFTPAISEGLGLLRKRERELEKELDEVRARTKKLKASASAFEDHMVNACKHVKTIQDTTAQL